MGKPYQQEIEALPETFRTAVEASMDSCATAVSASAQGPLVAIGSGGSLSVAEFAAMLHQHFTNHIAKASTPLDILSSGRKDHGSSFFLFTAGGRNKDILRAFGYLAVLEPRRLVVLTATKATLIGKEASRFQYVDNVEIPLPCGKDGFLATNSLLAFSTILLRAYEQVFGTSDAFPNTLDQFLLPGGTFAEFCDDLRNRCNRLWERENLVVLYSPRMISAARDLESRFTEAALGPTQIADFRHFAHGRHHWLAKRGSTSSVIALVNKDDEVLANKTLSLFPKDIPVTKLDFGVGSPRDALKALISSIVLAGYAGLSRGIDPGRPGVPPFGRKIYNLGPLTKGREQFETTICAPIERKLSGFGSNGINEGVLKTWSGRLKLFSKQLQAQLFHGLILDYDGTICDDRCRFTGPEQGIVKMMASLLRSGVPVGIATGRGESVRADLRRCIPSRFWGRVLIGYHNGSEIALLSDDSQPSATEVVSESLVALVKAFENDTRLREIAKSSVSEHQISIRPHPAVPLDNVWSLLQEMIARATPLHVRMVRSSHSIDVLAPGISKLSVVSSLRTTFSLKADAVVLCIGDRGRWPGNDYDLLSLPHSLSVDEVSTSSETCWNLAPPGHRGSQALVDYLNAIRTDGREFRMVVSEIGRGAHER